jgi:septation ring formation regulator EzrA|tara:strand:- start:1867 stop:2115 length:249 start_codon:yes stop_codon:yes gene_type:complete
MSKKIEEQELKKVQNYEQQMTSIKMELGSIQLNTHILKNTYTTLMQEYNSLRKELEDKYGKVQINISDGSYEEIKENEPSNK